MIYFVMMGRYVLVVTQTLTSSTLKLTMGLGEVEAACVVAEKLNVWASPFANGVRSSVTGA